MRSIWYGIAAGLIVVAASVTSTILWIKRDYIKEAVSNSAEKVKNSVTNTVQSMYNKTADTTNRIMHTETDAQPN